MRLSVYLPTGYNASQRYPVLYFIHGYGSRETDMWGGLELQKNADRLIEAGQIEPLIIVSPQMDNSYGLNAVANPGDPASLGSERYEDYLVKDVVEYTDTHFNTLAERGSRYIGGISMGGFISLHSAFFCIAMSIAGLAGIARRCSWMTGLLLEARTVWSNSSIRRRR
ncbi:alpha/beta hydrolase [Paenibacillus rhizoplanae]